VCLGSFWEFGVPSRRGQRNDLSRVVKSITDGMDIRAVALAHPQEFVRYSRGIERLHYHHSNGTQRRNWTMEVRCFIGESGTGKSWRANKEAEESGGDIYYKPRGKWWDGYTGQDNVIIDDFYGWIKFDEMLRILDRYPHQVEIKGGFANFVSKRIWITSNKEIEDWYKERSGEPFDEERLAPLRRRIREFGREYYFSKINNENVVIERNNDILLNAINEII